MYSARVARAASRVGRLAAGFPGLRPRREALLRLARAQHGDELGLAALAVALAQLGGERRARAVPPHALDLRVV